jgi:ribulose-5-phosphate 4-epimerase/fuculose-1-phosphate aldolase
VNAAESIEQLKHNVALASRILDVSGATSAFGHISMRLPGEDAFLLSCARAVGLVRPDDVLVIGLDGVRRSGEGLMFSETAIHAAAYRARPDVQSVAHTHPEMCVSLSVADEELRPCHMTAYRYYDGVAIHPEGRMLTTAVMADAAVAAMGNRNAILLKWHGAIVVGPSLYWTCLGAVQLEFAARIQYQAHQVGQPSFFAREHAHEMYEQLEGARDTTAYHREWDYWVERVRAASGDDVFRLHGAYGAHGYQVPGQD